MNLLLVSEADVRVTASGGERVLASHVAGLVGRGHHVDVVCGGRGAPTVDGPVRIRRVGWSLATPLRARAAAQRLATRRAPDALVVYHAFPAYGVLGAPSLTGTPAVYAFLSSWPEEYLVRHPGVRGVRRAVGVGVRRRIERGVLDRVARVLPMSEFMAGRLQAVHAVPFGRTTIVPGGVDVDRFAPRDRAGARDAFGLPADVPVVLTLRNLEPRMGVDVLIDAMPAIRGRCPGVVLVVAGSGPLRGALEARAAGLGLHDAVRFTGFVPEERLADLYAAADVFVLPTQALEGFGLVTLEALACGTPVLGTPVGATPELLRGLDGSLVTADASPAALEAAVVRFLAREDRAALAERCRHWALGWDWASAVRALEAELHEARAAAAAPRGGDPASRR